MPGLLQKPFPKFPDEPSLRRTSGIMWNETVELARFPTSAEAAIVRSRLEVEEIDSEMEGESFASWMWHFGPAIGGVRLFVRAEDGEPLKAWDTRTYTIPLLP